MIYPFGFFPRPYFIRIILYCMMYNVHLVSKAYGRVLTHLHRTRDERLPEQNIPNESFTKVRMHVTEST
jgi:hypothetical protein